MKKVIPPLFCILFGCKIMGQTKFQINDYPLNGQFSIISKDSATKVFDKIKSSKIFEYRYTRGGCDYRAHGVYTLLNKMGITTFKIWNFASSKIFLAGKDFNTHNLLLRTKDQVNLSTQQSYYKDCNINIDSNVFWGYHVAPVILVEDNKKVDTLVIDPALFNSPIDYKLWIKEPLQQNATSYFIFLNGEFISFQTESQYQRSSGNCQDCSGNNIITGVFFDENFSIQQKWIEQSLSKGRVFVEYYETEIEPLEVMLLKYPLNTTDPKALKLACEIATKKQSISNESGLVNLPEKYQVLYGKYVTEATKALFEK